MSDKPDGRSQKPNEPRPVTDGHNSLVERIGEAEVADDFSLRDHGHLTLQSLHREIRADEMAAKQEDAHWYGHLRQTLGDKPMEKERASDIER